MSQSTRLLALLPLLCAACAQGARDPNAPPACGARAIRIYQAPSYPAAKRSVLAHTTVTCTPLNPKYCERLLRERACEHDADVVVLETRTLIGRRGPAQVTQKAELIRPTPQPP